MRDEERALIIARAQERLKSIPHSRYRAPQLSWHTPDKRIGALIASEQARGKQLDGPADACEYLLGMLSQYGKFS